MASAAIAERARRRAFSWRRLGLVPCVLGTLALAACGKPAVHGSVLPNAAERSRLLGRRVEVRLIRGELIKELSHLAARYRRDAGPRALERARALLSAEDSERADALQHARAALASMDGSAGGTAAPAEGADSLSLRNCPAATEAQLAMARQDYAKLLATVAPRIAALDVQADTPAGAVPALRAAIQVKTANEQRRLRDEYLQSQLVQESRTVLAPGLGMDRLCWSGENRGDVGLRFRGVIVSFNGKSLPDAVAGQIWGLPPQDQPLRIPNGQTAKEDVLLPGAKFEACFYGRGAELSLDIANSYGLAVSSPTRGGKWRVQWRHISLVAVSPDGTQSTQEEALSTVFAGQLERFKAGLEETRLIEAITRSAAARAVKQAEARLLACHRAIEAEEAYQEVERALHAIAEGHTEELAVQARLRPVLQRDLSEPKSVADWVRNSTALVDRRTIARQERELGQTFEFSGLAPGDYTLLAESKPGGSRPKLWVLPIQVEEPVERDLEMATARDMTLAKMLEDILLQPQRVPSS